MASTEAAGCVVFCEGKEDAAVLGWPAAQAGLLGLHIRPVPGKDRPAPRMRAILQGADLPPNPAVVAAVFDADLDPAAARASAPGALGHAAPNAERRVHLLPNDERCGALQDLCVATASDQVRRQCAEGYVECLWASGQTEFNAGRAAALADIGGARGDRRSLGYAAEAGEFSPRHPWMLRLAEFLAGLAAYRAA